MENIIPDASLLHMTNFSKNISQENIQNACYFYPCYILSKVFTKEIYMLVKNMYSITKISLYARVLHSLQLFLKIYFTVSHHMN